MVKTANRAPLTGNQLGYRMFTSLEQVLRLGDDEDKTLFSTDTLLLPSSEVIGAEIRQ